jgi:hypothetical protein
MTTPALFRDFLDTVYTCTPCNFDRMLKSAEYFLSCGWIKNVYLEKITTFDLHCKQNHKRIFWWTQIPIILVKDPHSCPLCTPCNFDRMLKSAEYFLSWHTMFLQKWTRMWIFNQNNRSLGSPENSFMILFAM